MGTASDVPCLVPPTTPPVAGASWSAVLQFQATDPEECHHAGLPHPVPKDARTSRLPVQSPQAAALGLTVSRVDAGPAVLRAVRVKRSRSGAMENLSQKRPATSGAIPYRSMTSAEQLLTVPPPGLRDGTSRMAPRARR